jgi:hypothetical protein
MFLDPLQIVQNSYQKINPTLFSTQNQHSKVTNMPRWSWRTAKKDGSETSHSWAITHSEWAVFNDLLGQWSSQKYFPSHMNCLHQYIICYSEGEASSHTANIHSRINFCQFPSFVRNLIMDWCSNLMGLNLLVVVAHLGLFISLSALHFSTKN